MAQIPSSIGSKLRHKISHSAICATPVANSTQLRARPDHKGPGVRAPENKLQNLAILITLKTVIITEQSTIILELISVIVVTDLPRILLN